jgi:bacterioferritin (cytochrome b1)
MSGKEQQENLVARMKQWQKLETAAVAQTARIIEKTEHPLIRLVAEIIQRDSQMHHRTQQLVIDSLEKASIPVPVEQLTEIWDAIEEHIRIERRTIETAKESLGLLNGSSSVLQRYLLSYLLADEKKHDKLLADLELIKRKMYP